MTMYIRFFLTVMCDVGKIADTQLVSDEIICIRALNHTESTEHYQIECREIADIQTTKVERTASRYKEAEHGRNSNS